MPNYLPTNDLLFHKLFTSKDTNHILKAFVRDVLGEEFETLTPRDTYHIDSYKQSLEDENKLKYTEVDVLAASNDGTQVTIEMQVRSHDFFRERAVFYLSAAYASPYGDEDAEAFEEDNQFSTLRAAYGINIIDFHMFPRDEDALQNISYHNDKTHRPFLGSQGQKIHRLCFLSLKNKNIEPDSPVYHWQQFFKTGQVAEHAPQYLKDAQKKVNYYSLNEEEKKMIMRVDKGRAIRNAELSTARREGREEGKKEGRKEGQAENKVETAINFLKMGLSPEQVAQGTDLSIEQVKELERQLE